MANLIAWPRLPSFHTFLTLGYFLFLVLAWYAPQMNIRLIVFIVMAGIGFYNWLKNYRRFQLIADIPTSSIRSAAQGYVELFGKCELHHGSLPLGFLSSPPCVWFRYHVWERVGNRWMTCSKGVSDETFLLKDNTGVCIIDPESAEVITTGHPRWSQGNYLYEVDYLAPSDTLYVLGELITLGRCNTQNEVQLDISTLLNEWKQDKASLLARFDSNGDGEISLNEWEQARLAAEREVSQQQREQGDRQALHLLHAPRDGRPFILATQDPDCLRRRYLYWSWWHLAVFIMSVCSLLTFNWRYR
jgi:hypothetical protein